jgi:hypothetical protein
MKTRLFSGLLLAGMLAVPMTAQMPGGYLDVFYVKVKMGKRAEFDAVAKKMVEINRKNKGDTWLAQEVVYGDASGIYLTSPRANFAGIDDGIKAFEGSLTKALGAAGMRKLFADFDAAADAERGELRRRRIDLTANAPADQAAYLKLVGESRYVRTAIIHLRPGKILDYEAQLKRNKSAQERANPGIPSFVAQGVAGQATGTFYVTTLVKSLGDLDQIKTVQEVLGSGYESYMKAVADDVLSTDILIGRFRPDLSNPPEEVVAVDPKYWRPAPPPPPPPSSAAAKPAAKQ